MKRLMLLCCALAATVAGASGAAEPGDLYEAEVPVADQRAAARAEAARAALAEVLVKVTGDSAAPSRPALRPLLQQAEQWLQRYQYRPAPAGAGGQLLVASFDREALKQQIYAAGLPVWAEQRPRLLLWLAVEDGGRALIGGDAYPELQAAALAEARRRGLPVSLPQADEQDRAALAAGAATQVGDDLLRAAARYDADGVLLGRLTPAGPQRWRGQWTVSHAGRSASWNAEGAPAELVAQGIGAAAAELAQRYALVLTPGVGSVATLVVDGVGEVQDYARVSRYLSSLDPVSTVAVERVDGEQVVYRLGIRGELQGLTRLLAAGKVLGPASAAAGEPLAYRLIE